MPHGGNQRIICVNLYKKTQDIKTEYFDTVVDIFSYQNLPTNRRLGLGVGGGGRLRAEVD